MFHRSAGLAVFGLWLTAGGVQADVPSGVNLAALAGWDIVIAEDAIPSEVYAAEEFQSHAAQATSVTLPIVKAVDRPDRHVFIGSGKLMRESSLGFSVDDFGPEDLRIVIRDKAIVIAGGRPRGTLYGVYVFLEDYLGVRFLTADHTHVPPVGVYRMVGPVDRFHHPALEMRFTYYGEILRNPVFATRLRINTVADDPKLGGKARQRLVNHTLYRQIPSSKYGKEHPEYYCMRDGKRMSQVKDDVSENQPCLTHPDVLRIVTESVLAELAAHPDVGNISVSQNDNRNFCQCPACAAIDEREGTSMGSLLTFVNAVADAVAEKYPDVKVGTLAYQYSRKPPKTLRPRPNVQIQLCSIECCQLHPIDDPNCPRNVEFCSDLTGWGKISENVYIWNYNTNFLNYLLPCPNLRVIDPNVRFFLAHNAKGVFMQAAGNAYAAELSELRNYIISNLLWDATRRSDQLLDEFLDLHYGPSAPPIRRFIEHVHDRAEASGTHRHCYGNLIHYGLDETDAQAGLDAFAEALRLADSDVIRARVEQASICAYRAAIEPVYYASEQEPVSPVMVQRFRPLVKRFFELCDRYHVDRPRESWEDIGEARRRLKAAFGEPEDGPF